jgi:hypothetical protein
VSFALNLTIPRGRAVQSEYATMASLSPGFAGRIVGAPFRTALSLAWSSVLFVALAAPPLSRTAHAHGIAGNRYFPGTLTFDDPAVADEAIVPNFSKWDHSDGGGNVTDNRINWSFTRLLTPTVGFFVDSSWMDRNWGPSHRAGFDVTTLGVKWEVYRNNPAEALAGWHVG